jgi:hypothetical protein
MSGEARVNDSICLHHDGSGNSSITIGGDLTGPAGPVATIDLYSEADPALRWDGAQVLRLAADFSGNLSTFTGRFTLGSFISVIDSSPVFTPITGGINANGTLTVTP